MNQGHTVQLAGRRAGVLLAMAVLLLTAACGGNDSSKPATQTGGTTLGAAEGTVSGGAASAAPAASPAARAASTPPVPAVPAQAQSSATAVDACRIVSKEELEAALGFALNPGQRVTNPIGAAECAYKAPSDANPGTMPTVTVAIFRSRLARTTYDTLRESAPSRATDVPGLGDKAYVAIGSTWTDNRELEVLQGDVLVSINLTAIINPAVSMSDEEKRTKLITLARTALGRL